MSDRNRNKNKASKSSYVRAARKQKLYEEQFIDMVSGSTDSYGNKKCKSKTNKNHMHEQDYDDFDY